MGKGYHWRSYLCHCSLGSQIEPDDEGGGFVGYIGYNRMVRSQGTDVLHQPSNQVDRKEEDRLHFVLSSAMKEVALRDIFSWIIGIRDLGVLRFGSRDRDGPISWITD